jgi:YidC/Oxa1 family membrane protein insertase
VEEAAATATHSAQRTVEDIVENAFNTDLSDVVHKGAGLIEKHGALKELGLDYGWGPTAFFEWMIEHIYLDTGIGWGASIIAVTLLIRVALFKFQMNGSDSMAKMQAVAPVVKDLSDKMAEAIKNGDDETNREARKRQMQIYKAIGVKPINTIAPMLMQGVIGFGAFRCLRGMSTLPVPGMDQSGWLWFTDLTVTDPYHLLPFLSGGIMCLAMKVSGAESPVRAEPDG